MAVSLGRVGNVFARVFAGGGIDVVFATLNICQIDVSFVTFGRWVCFLVNSYNFALWVSGRTVMCFSWVSVTGVL